MLVLAEPLVNVSVSHQQHEHNLIMGKHKDKSKKHKKEKKSKKSKKRERRSSTSDSASSEDGWIEKKRSSSSSPPGSPPVEEEKKERDEWLSMPSAFLTSSNKDRRRERELSKKLEKERSTYNPSKSSRELNPYWKDGGDGLPTNFKKPSLDDEEDDDKVSQHSSRKSQVGSGSGWRKKKSPPVEEEVTSSSEEEPAEVLSGKEKNALAAKLIKAEIMGDTKLVDELKRKLKSAREAGDSAGNDTDVLLTRTDSKGYTRPVRNQSDYGEGTSKGKKRKVETHTGGERVRYFADDDKYSLKQMFENEKFSSVEDSNNEFLKLAGKVSRDDDLDDIFTDKIRREESSTKTDKRNKDRAVGEHQKITRSLDSCNKCLQSESMLKHLMVSMGNSIYLSLPSHEPLTDGHCLLIPIKHTPCATQLDENEWFELMAFRRALTRMYQSRDEDVVFFETAKYLNHFPHMVVECIPLPKETGDLAPIYFKKAIDESETEWASNKKLISLAGKNVQKAVPKGLPYFTVSFGLEEGYAHVIEDQQLFPGTFAQEIIGGMLDLDHGKWRKPKHQTFEEQSKRVLDFSGTWNEFNFT